MIKEFRRKVVVSYVLLVLLPFLTLQPLCFTQVSEAKQLILAMLNSVQSCEFKYHRRIPAGEEAVSVGFQVTGEEVVAGESAWRVRGWIASAEEKGEGMLWISKSTGATLMVQIDDEVVTGEQAELIAAVFLNLLAFAVGNVGALRNATVLQYGKIFLLGYGMEEFGSTRLLVYKWRYDGYETAPPEYRFRQEVWMAPMSFGYLLVKLWFEKYDGTESGGFDITSIKLTNPQPLPNVTVRIEADRTCIKPGEEVTFRIACVNTGAATGIHNLTVSVDGIARESWLFILNPGESENRTFRVLFAEEGEHTVRIGDEIFTVSVRQTSPAKLEVVAFRIEPEAPKAGETVTITVTVRNMGGETGTRNVTLKIGGTLLESRKVTLEPGESINLTFRYTPEREGNYQVDVDGFNKTVVISRSEEQSILTPPYLMVLIVAVAVVAAIIVILRRKAAQHLP